MSIQSYDPEMAEMINKQIKSQANVGICCAVICNCPAMARPSALISGSSFRVGGSERVKSTE